MAEPKKPTKAQIKELFAAHESATATEERNLRAYGLDVTRQWVGEGGYRLSDSVWDARQDVRDRIDAVLRRAIADGTDALVVADLLETSLRPELRPVRLTPGGAFVANQRRGIVTQSPNVKEYAASLRPFAGSYSARRLARTEISRAHAVGTDFATARTPFARGWRWNLSPAHPRQDICDSHANRDDGLGAGVFPANDGPTMPAHPHCLCDKTVETVDDIDAVIAGLRDQYGLGVDEAAAGPTEQDPPDALTIPIGPPGSAFPLPSHIASRRINPSADAFDHDGRLEMLADLRGEDLRWDLEADAESFFENITEDQGAALERYTTADHKTINQIARGRLDAADFEDYEDVTRHLDEAFDEAQLRQDVLLYRGTSSDSVLDQINDLGPGDMLTDWGFGSYTLDAEVGEQFAYGDGVVFEILAPKGSRGIYIEPITRTSGELEVLTPRGTTLVIHEIDTSGPAIFVRGEIIPYD